MVSAFFPGKEKPSVFRVGAPAAGLVPAFLEHPPSPHPVGAVSCFCLWRRRKGREH